MRSETKEGLLLSITPTEENIQKAKLLCVGLFSGVNVIKNFLIENRVWYVSVFERQSILPYGDGIVNQSSLECFARANALEKLPLTLAVLACLISPGRLGKGSVVIFHEELFIPKIGFKYIVLNPKESQHVSLIYQNEIGDVGKAYRYMFVGAGKM